LILKTAGNMNSYRVNFPEVKRKLAELNNPEVQAEELRENGRYVRYFFRLLPINQIRVPSVWSPSKLPSIQKAILEGRPLPPIRAYLEGSKYEIEDGIHRVNASIEAGFTLVPAIVSELAHK
jgi:hypothetical protein